MSSPMDHPFWSGGVTTYTYDGSAKLRSIEEHVAPACQCEHDEAKKVFRVTGPDGPTTEFHDRAVRFLVVEPDPTTGKLTPVLSTGEPRIVYLCREAGL